MSESNSLFKSVVKVFESNKATRDSGKYTNIPFLRFPKIAKAIPGVQKGRYTIVTANSKVGKCFAKGTKVRMYDGTVKEIENIKDGDKLMGPDSQPRIVQGVTSGKETMYKISSKYFNDLVVNESHILHLEEKVPQNISTYKGRNTSKRKSYSRKINISVKDFLKLSPNIQKRFRLVQAKIEYKSQKLELDPYFLGLWIGDGDKNSPSITNIDTEIIGYLKTFSDSNNLKLNNLDIRYFLSNYDRSGNFKNLVLDNSKKFIKKDYLLSSIEDRLKLLAGLIDSDGYRVKNSTYEITTQYETLSKDILELTRSLGFESYVFPKYNAKYDKDYYTVRFKGINPYIKVERKKSTYTSSRNNKSFSIEKLNQGEYFGFTVDKDNLFLLEDYMVVHNTQLADALYVQEPLNYVLNGEDPDISVKIFYFSLEMSKHAKMSSLISNELSMRYGIQVDPQNLESQFKDYILEDHILDKIKELEEHFNNVEQSLEIIDNIRNPYGMYKHVRNYLESVGEYVYKETIWVNDDGSKTPKKVIDKYVPNDPNHYVIVITDHVSLLTPEKTSGGTLHGAIGKWSSDHCLELRDKYNCCIVNVQQQSADSERQQFTNSGRTIVDKLKPSPDYLGDNRLAGRDCDLMIGLFAPHRYGIASYAGYNILDGIKGLRDNYREFIIMLNRRGSSNLCVDLFFDGRVNFFKELPPPDSFDMNHVLLRKGLKIKDLNLNSQQQEILLKQLNG